MWQLAYLNSPQQSSNTYLKSTFMSTTMFDNDNGNKNVLMFIFKLIDYNYSHHYHRNTHGDASNDMTMTDFLNY